MRNHAANLPTRATRSSAVSPMSANWPALAVLVLLALFPFVLGLLDGQSLGAVLASQSGNSKFYQGLFIEIFILAIYALSYDLLFGVTGLLSFGHAMFFAVGAYVLGVGLKSLGLPLPLALVLVVVAAVVQALLFSIVLPRVQGITFALVTLGFAAVFEIVVQSHELNPYTGGDVGLQNIPKPEYLNPADQRLAFYFVSLTAVAVAYLVYRRFVDSPTGRVCVAIRENENRAKMLGYNTFYFKLAALTLSSITAALAGALNTLYQPIVSPTIAGLGYTVAALLMILIGGVGTLSGALVGAAVYRLLQFYLDRFFGEASSFLLGLVYIILVLFVPFGIIGTWRARSLQWRAAWRERFQEFAGQRPQQ